MRARKPICMCSFSFAACFCCQSEPTTPPPLRRVLHLPLSAGRERDAMSTASCRSCARARRRGVTRRPRLHPRPAAQQRQARTAKRCRAHTTQCRRAGRRSAARAALRLERASECERLPRRKEPPLICAGPKHHLAIVSSHLDHSSRAAQTAAEADSVRSKNSGTMTDWLENEVRDN